MQNARTPTRGMYRKWRVRQHRLQGREAGKGRARELQPDRRISTSNCKHEITLREIMIQSCFFVFNSLARTLLLFRVLRFTA